MNIKRLICKILDMDKDGLITVRDIINVIVACIVCISIMILVVIMVGLFAVLLIYQSSEDVSEFEIMRLGIIGTFLISILLIIMYGIFYTYYKIEDKVLYTCPLKKQDES